MTIKKIELGIIKICLLGLLVGCASAPDIDTDKYAGLELNNKSLDLLFATEFPVTSETEALLEADRALRQGDMDKALFYYVRALQFQPENVESLVKIGDIQLRNNNLAFAGRAFLAAQQYDPNHARAHEGLGLIYMAEDRHEQAISEFKLAVEFNDGLW
jgi:tetratricopeptide (TPR) repeat protein